MGEQETRDTAVTTRSQSVVHHIERDQDDAARMLSALLERSAAAEASPAVLVIVPTSDDALSLTESLVAHRSQTLSPITSAARGRRVLSTGPRAIAGAASDLAALVAESRLALSALQTLVIVWPEEIIASEQSAALDKVLGEVPKTVDRIAISAVRTPELTQFLERAMWRARTVDHRSANAAATSTTVRVLAAPPREQLRALRTVLDAFDPSTTVLLAFTDESEAAARNAASVLGADGNLVVASRGVPGERFSLGVIIDDVPPVEALNAASAATGELIAIVRPTRLAAFNKVAPGATPLTWTGALGNARSAHDALREEIRSSTSSGLHLSWVPIVEPLLEGLDAVDVAAAALALLDRERRRSKKTAASAQVAPPVEREARPDSFKRPQERDDRRDRPDRGFPKSRDAGGWKGPPRKRDDDVRRGPPRDRPARDDRGRGRDDRGRDDSRGRGGRPAIERVPRAAHEGREWSERGERLKNSRRGPRGGAAEGK
jgi:hypothetical protein